MQRAFSRLCSAFSKQKNSRPVSQTGEMERLFRKGVDRRAVWNNSGVNVSGQAGANKVYSLNFGDAKESETKVVIRLIKNNIQTIDAENKFSVSLENNAVSYNKKSEYILDIFDAQGNAAYNSQIGNVELVRSGAKSTIAHGFGNVKLASVSAIKDVIEKGNIISKTDNYDGKGITRYVVAAKGLIGNKPAYVGVVVKSYPNSKFNPKFYLHEAIIIETDSHNMTAPQLSVDTVSESASNTTVPQNGTGVNSYDMQNGGENSQFSFGGVNGTDINVPYEGELTTPPPSDDGTSPDKGRPGDAANSQALQNLDEAAEVEVQPQEMPEGTAGATETVYQPEAVPSRENERKKVAQGRTLEELEQELSDRELFNRAYMSEIIDRPPQTVSGSLRMRSVKWWWTASHRRRGKHVH